VLNNKAILRMDLNKLFKHSLISANIDQSEWITIYKTNRPTLWQALKRATRPEEVRVRGNVIDFINHELRKVDNKLQDLKKISSETNGLNSYVPII